MTKLDAALLKLEGALDYTTDPRVRTLIDVAQQAIEAAKQVMAATPQEVNERIELAYAAHNGPHLSEQQRRAAQSQPRLCRQRTNQCRKRRYYREVGSH